MSGDQHFYKKNRLKLLRAFCTAAQLESFSAAAEQLFLSQPTVSLQIQSLERDIGATLFERHGPKIKLTPEGEVFYQLAKPLLEQFNRLEASFKASIGKLEGGELRIAAGESTILYILPDALQEFTDSYPTVNISLHNVTGRDGMSMLRADEADFAIGSMINVPDDMVYQPVWRFNPTLIMPKGHPLAKIESPSIEQISEYGLILPPRHLATWRVIEAEFEKHDVKLKVSLEAGGWEVIKRYVSLGLGISIVTDICLSEQDELIQKPLLKFFPRRTYGIVVRKGKFLTPQAKRFIDMIDDTFFHNIE
jgi:DNA-binding transcriptional LysR family regulator